MNEHLQPEPNEVRLSRPANPTIAFYAHDKPVVTIDPHAGTVTLAPGATWDTAAVAFWDAIRRMMPTMRDYDAAIAAAEARATADLRGFIARALPFLEEAWTACFHGQKERLLSAEERGMREIILRFREVAAGKPAMPIGCVPIEEAHRMSKAQGDYYHRLLGFPNELPEDLREWIRLGETCADGLRRAIDEVTRLRALTTARPA